jgi:hypothetical protein
MAYYDAGAQGGLASYAQQLADEQARAQATQNQIWAANQGGGTIPAGDWKPAKSSSSSSSKATQAAYDPWSKFRAQMGAQLAGQTAANDPSNFYADKMKAMATDGASFTPNDPSFKFRQQQGQQVVERSLAAKGLLNSGNAAIELQEYGQQSASQEFGAQFQRMLQGFQSTSANYDASQRRLMEMAGVNLDPTAGAKLDLQQQQIDNDYALGLQKNQNQATANSLQSMSSGGSSAPRVNLAESYAVANNEAAQWAMQSELFFGRPGGVADSSGGTNTNAWFS